MSIQTTKRFHSIVLNGNRYMKNSAPYGLVCALCDLKEECASNAENHNLGKICDNITRLQEYWVKADDVKKSQ